jgi:hypothetical protein
MQSGSQDVNARKAAILQIRSNKWANDPDIHLTGHIDKNH